jgi:hypothetical protein
LPSFLSSNRSDSSKPYTVTPPQPAMQCREHKTRDTHTHTHHIHTHEDDDDDGDTSTQTRQPNSPAHFEAA